MKIFDFDFKPRSYKKSCTNHLSMKLILLISVKMPSNVGVLTFISSIDITHLSFNAREIFIFQRFSFHGNSKFRTQLSLKNQFYYLVAGLVLSALTDYRYHVLSNEP